MRRTLYALFALARPSLAVFMPQIFTDGLVLQTPDDGGAPASIFGYANPGEAVAVNMTIGDALTRYTATADAAGKWRVVVAPAAGDDPAPKGVAFSVAAASDTTPTLIRNASFGEVLLCNGQSNMVLSVAAASNPVGRAAPPSPQLQYQTWYDVKLFSVISTNSSVPTRGLPLANNSRGDKDCTWGYVANMTPASKVVCTTWQVAAPGVTDFFSAECFYAAHNLVTSGAIPAGRTVGLVQTAYSGTAMEQWVPESALAGCPARANAPPAAGTSPPWIPGCLAADGPIVGCLWNDMYVACARALAARRRLHNRRLHIRKGCTRSSASRCAPSCTIRSSRTWATPSSTTRASSRTWSPPGARSGSRTFRG